MPFWERINQNAHDVKMMTSRNSRNIWLEDSEKLLMLMQKLENSLFHLIFFLLCHVIWPNFRIIGIIWNLESLGKRNSDKLRQGETLQALMCWFGLVFKSFWYVYRRTGICTVSRSACRVGALPSNNAEVQLAVGQSNVRSYLKRVFTSFSCSDIFYNLETQSSFSNVNNISQVYDRRQEPHLPSWVKDSFQSIKTHVNQQWAHLGWLLVLSILVLNWWRRLAVIQSHAQQANFVWLFSLSEFQHQQVSNSMKVASFSRRSAMDFCLTWHN